MPFTPDPCSSDILLESEAKALLYSPSLDKQVVDRDAILANLFPCVKDGIACFPLPIPL